MKKRIALLLAVVMVLALAACGPTTPATDPTTQPTTQPTTEPTTEPTTQLTTEPTEPQAQYPLKAISADNDPYIVPKYTETVTADGWIKVENEGGDTLGYHPDSGVQLIQVEGFAFKDLDKDGELDGYEDWRNTNEDRAWDLAYQMAGAEMANLMSHGGWGSFTTEPITEENSTYAFLQAGGRGGVSRNIGNGGAAHATWANQIQIVAESCFYGIPAMISIDPANISGLIETVSLASTMNPELAAQIGNLTAQKYRAAGVTALLGPQVDIASPIMSRAGGTYGEDLEEHLRITLSWEQGANLLGGYGTMDNVALAYDALVERNGAEKADAILRKATYNFLVVMMNLEMFENPYSDSAYAQEIINGEAALEFGIETQRQSVVMIKNDGTIKAAEGEVTEKPTIYVPWAYNNGFSISWMSGISQGDPSWSCPLNIEALSEYFNVVTDTLGEPTGEPNARGNATYTKDDIIRATADQIAACDYILVGMTGAYTESYESHMSGAMGGAANTDGDNVWYPASLQYRPYTADTARDPSLAGKVIENVTYDPYGAVISKETVIENRSYKGNTAVNSNEGQLDALEYAASVAGDIPVIVSVTMARGMVWSEVEPLADVILVSYNSHRTQVVSEIILGQTEPNGLLVFQQPKDMLVVEAQVDDVPRDMECHVDANGNTYDFAFGMNWAGVINDERVAKYSADPISELQNYDFDAYFASYNAD